MLALSRRASQASRSLEQRPDAWPVVVDDREHRDVAQPGPVGAPRVLAQDALERRAGAGDRAPRLLVARVGLELDARRAEHLEGVLEQQQLGGRVQAGAAPRRAVPGVPDLDAAVAGRDVEVARRAGDDAVARAPRTAGACPRRPRSRACASQSSSVESPLTGPGERERRRVGPRPRPRVRRGGARRAAPGGRRRASRTIGSGRCTSRLLVRARGASSSTSRRPLVCAASSRSTS